MDNIAGTQARLTWAVNIAVVALVLLWTIPTIGLFVSSFRDRDQITTSGWWTALSASEQNIVLRTAAPDQARQEGGVYVLSGNVLDGGKGEVTAFGVSSRAPTEFTPGDTAERKGAQFTVQRQWRLPDYVGRAVQRQPWVACFCHHPETPDFHARQLQDGSVFPGHR